MSTAQTLILAGEGYSLGIAPEAESAKAELLTQAAGITAVIDSTSAETARQHVKKLAAMRNLVEKSRKAVKEPVIDVGRKIDDKAKEFSAELISEETRITGLIGAHAAEVERKRQEAERERLRLEREESERQAAAERQRQAEEAAARKAAEEAEKARLAAQEAEWADSPDQQAEAKRQAEEAERAAAEARRQAVEAEAARQAEAAKAKEDALAAGMLAQSQGPAGVSWVYDFETTDIASLYKARPELVELSAKRSLILAELKAQAERGEEPSLPGLHVKREPKVRTR